MASTGKRNYKAEYKRRIERALKKGYSRAIARGHPKTKTTTYTDRAGEKRKRKTTVELGIKAAKFLNERPGENIEKIIKRDAKYVFGKKPKRKYGESLPAYQLRLEGMKTRKGTFDWQNEAVIIEQMRAIGLSERDAYKNWLSP